MLSMHQPEFVCVREKRGEYILGGLGSAIQLSTALGYLNSPTLDGYCPCETKGFSFQLPFGPKFIRRARNT